MVNYFSLYWPTTCGLLFFASYRQTFDSVLEFSESGSMTIGLGPKPRICINFYCEPVDSVCLCFVMDAQHEAFDYDVMA